MLRPASAVSLFLFCLKPGDVLERTFITEILISHGSAESLCVGMQK